MGLENLFELFRQRNRLEAPTDLPGAAGEIYLKSTDWVNVNLAKTPEELGKQPFLLSQQAIEIIQTSLVETKSKELLGQRKYKKAADHETQLLLNNWFRQAYEKIFQELDLEHNPNKDAGMAASLKKYLEDVKTLGPRFISEKNTPSKLIKICNKVRGIGIGPVVLYLKAKAMETSS